MKHTLVLVLVLLVACSKSGGDRPRPTADACRALLDHANQLGAALPDDGGRFADHCRASLTPKEVDCGNAATDLNGVGVCMGLEHLRYLVVAEHAAEGAAGMVDELGYLRDRACACTDMSCGADMEIAYEIWRQRYQATKGNHEQGDQIAQVSHELSGCLDELKGKH